MTTQLSDFASYCASILGETPEIRNWTLAVSLPLYLRQPYEFNKVHVHGAEFLLMRDKRRMEVSPAVVEKQLNAVRSSAGIAVVYMRHAITSYNRKRLIEKRVQFVVPGRQWYVPSLGMDFRERFAAKSEAKSKVSPPTQLFIIYALNTRMNGTITPRDLSQSLQFNPMTSSRVLNELRDLGIGEHVSRPRRRTMTFDLTGKQLWEKVLPFLRSPVQQQHFVRHAPQGDPEIKAGLTALAKYSMLAEPTIPVYAVDRYEWRKSRLKSNVIPNEDTQSIEIQVWWHSPRVTAREGVVDPFSLFLSLRDNSDERVQEALSTTMSGIQW